jgi:phospholipase/carboxylesterase
MQNAVIIHQPAPPVRQLVLLFHGVGATPEDLRPLGQALVPHLDRPWVVSVRSPHLSESGSGWQWFSVRGIDEANRPARVAQAMPGFVQTVRQWQRETGLGAAATTLIGFSQGAIMSLEATQEPGTIARRVIAIAGRFAQPPRVAPPHTRIHLMHGGEDAVVPSRLSAQAAQSLEALGAQVTLDLFPGLGHGIDARVLERVVQRIQEDAGAG